MTLDQTQTRADELAELSRRVAVEVFGWVPLSEPAGRKGVVLWQLPSGDETQTERGEGFAESDAHIGSFRRWFNGRGYILHMQASISGSRFGVNEAGLNCYGLAWVSWFDKKLGMYRNGGKGFTAVAVELQEALCLLALEIVKAEQ